MKNVRQPGLFRRRSRVLLILLVGLLGLLASACDASTANYPQNIWAQQSEFARDTTGLFNLTAYFGIPVFVVVEAILIYAAFKYRRRHDETALPPQIHGSTRLEIFWVIPPVLILLAILTPTIDTIFKTQAPVLASENALEVQVIGHQFWWEFYYPEFDLTTANEVHLPAGRKVNFSLESRDVIHSFWIPALGGKRDVVPGHINHLWWTPDRPGTFLGQCAELCGYSHANMRMRAMVETVDGFNQWVQAQKRDAIAPTADVTAGATLFQQRGCAGCHAIQGTSANAKVGPNLTHFGSRTTVASGIMDNTPDNVKAWIMNPPQVKPGSIMPNLGLNDADATALSAYLKSLK